MNEFYPDDKRTGRELVVALADGVGTAFGRRDHDVHTRECSTWKEVLCDCGMPTLLRRISFGIGLVSGEWSKANAEYPAGSKAFDQESEAGRARTGALEDVVRVLAHVFNPDQLLIDPETEGRSTSN